MKPLILFVVICFLSSCGLITTLKTQEAYYEEHVISNSPIDTIKFDFVQNHIFIGVSIDGKEKRFILDTGAGTCLDQSLLKSITINNLGKKKTKGTNGKSVKNRVVVIPEIQINNLQFLNTVATIYDFSHLKKATGVSIDGILGSNSMNNCAWQINYADSTILITKDPDFLKNSPQSDTVSFNAYGRGTPELNLYVNNSILSQVVIDTGSNGQIDLNSSVKTGGTTIKKQVLNGSINNIRPLAVEVALIDELALNNQIHLELTEVTYMKTISRGLIGNGFLKNYTVTIDWLNQKLILDPITPKVKEAHHDNYGIFTYESDNGVYISCIYENSEAYKHGLRLNDQILSFNGKHLDNSNPKNYIDFKTQLKSSTEAITLEVLASEIQKSIVVLRKNRLDDLIVH